jgi:hypothetical protein
MKKSKPKFVCLFFCGPQDYFFLKFDPRSQKSGHPWTIPNGRNSYATKQSLKLNKMRGVGRSHKIA